MPLVFYCLFFGTNSDVSVNHFVSKVLFQRSFLINDKGFVMTGDLLYYLTIFFNSKLFRFCFRDNFPELLGESRELRKVFFENINVIPVQDETWYKEILEQIIDKKRQGLSIEKLQNQIDEKIFNLYELSKDERELIISGPDSIIY